MRLDVIPERLDFEYREIWREAFGFLQAQHIRLRMLQICQQMRQPRFDRIDVPAGDFHETEKEVQATEKELPQPQDEAAFGFRIWNEAPIRSSTKSTSAPFNRSSETSSTIDADPVVSNTKSSSLR